VDGRKQGWGVGYQPDVYKRIVFAFRSTTPHFEYMLQDRNIFCVSDVFTREMSVEVAKGR